jgi:hypothetical protein
MWGMSQGQAQLKPLRYTMQPRLLRMDLLLNPPCRARCARPRRAAFP